MGYASYTNLLKGPQDSSRSKDLQGSFSSFIYTAVHKIEVQNLE